MKRGKAGLACVKKRVRRAGMVGGGWMRVRRDVRRVGFRVGVGADGAAGVGRFAMMKN